MTNATPRRLSGARTAPRPSSPARGRTALLLLLAALTVAVAAAVQPLRITGRVVDDATGRPLAGVRVSLVGTSLATATDPDGAYVLVVPDRESGATLRIHAAVAGYLPELTALPGHDQAGRSDRTLDFRLRRAVSDQEQAVALPGEIGIPAPPRQDRGAADRSSTGEAVSLHAPGPSRGVSGFGAGRPGWGPPPFDREQYAHIDENDFRASRDHPLSTFSIDVDRASYSNVRRFLLREGRLPPVDAVQVEELINYFPWDYARPRGHAPLAVTTEVGTAPWRPEHRLLRIGLASDAIDTADLPPANLVFLLDVSGSMHAPDKLPLVKRALGLLVDQLREEDRVAIAVYAGAAGLVLEPTSGAHRERILEAIQGLETGGSTAGGAGLRLAYGVAHRHFVQGGNNRVILATDGDFNVGESSDAAMVRLVEERREEGTFLTVLGFGTGNLQNTRMQEMAQHGNGNYAYIDGLAEARKVLVGEMGGTLLTVARDVKIQVEFNPARVLAYRLLGYENRLLAAEDFNDDGKDAGELGAGHAVTALYEIVPVGSDSDVDPPAVDPLRYRGDRRTPGRSGTEGRGGHESGGEAVQAHPGAAFGADGELAFVKVRYKEPGEATSRLIEHPVRDLDDGTASSGDFRFASAVAGFGMLLRRSEHAGSMTAEQVLELARSGVGDDAQGYRRGFLELVEAYRSLSACADAGEPGRWRERCP